jgi:biotin/methionine sulfoxide reductase
MMSTTLPSPADPARLRHSSHVGAFNALVQNGRLTGVEPFERDTHPSPLINAVPSAIYSHTRIDQPYVRASWLADGPGANTARRGREEFVPVSWEKALDMVAREQQRVRAEHGHEAVFGGSYGWSSAGRFHHAKTQLQRFLGLAGGYTDQKHSYSNAAGHAILPHIFGDKTLGFGPFTSWDSVADHADMFVSFGGLGLKNTQVEPGGMGEHGTHKWIPRLKEAGVRVVSITPIRDDTAAVLDAEWLAPRPNSDVALMLGVAHTLITEGLHDRAFLDGYCIGFEVFEKYVLGTSDGVPKTVEWAAELTGLPADRLRTLAREMASGRTMIGVAYSLQRAEHGEQSFWMGATLAAMMGQIGLPGGGIGYGYGSMNGYGNPVSRFAVPALSRGNNPGGGFIPVARIADMLLNPGGNYTFNGEDRVYPDARLVHWCGGNPFHHHQDLNRLIEAWRKPDTIVVNEIWWTPTARYADIVLPATSTLERNDIGASSRDRFVMAMQKAIEPVGQARNDFDIFSALAQRMGFESKFTEDRDEADWLRHLYAVSHQQAARHSISLPDFEEFWREGYAETNEPEEPFIAFKAFREDPNAAPLHTPSGKVEIFSSTIDGFGLEDCPGHPVWREPQEWLGAPLAERFPLHLVSNQPAKKLHSQMDPASVSASGKRDGREPTLIHPDDAAARNVADGDTIRVFNDRGEMVSVAEVSDGIMRGVIRVSTGAWFDPSTPGKPGSIEKHGNPNVLTRDAGTSSLTQGPIAHSTLVNFERFDGDPPPVTAFVLPEGVTTAPECESA